MFDNIADSSKARNRKEGTLTKLDRMRKTLNHTMAKGPESAG